MVLVTQIILASLLHSPMPFDGPGDPLKIKPIQTLQGGDSHIHAPMVRIIPSQKQWAELWNIHKGAQAVRGENGEITFPDAPTPPTVDFSKNQVLVIFGGKLPNVQAYDYVKTLAKDDTAIVQLSQNFVPASTEEKTYYPFILMVVPREPVKIEVQLDSIAKDGSHFWMTIGRYAPPKTVG